MRSTAIFHSLTEEILFIRDADDGRMSITNDAEAVVMKCHEIYPGRRIVYRDTEGRWDELLHDGPKFTGFATYDGEVPEPK